MSAVRNAGGVVGHLLAWVLIGLAGGAPHGYRGVVIGALSGAACYVVCVTALSITAARRAGPFGADQ